MTEELLSDGLGAFAMVRLGPENRLLPALSAGRLKGRDVAVLWALLANVDWRSGRSWATTSELALQLGHSSPRAVQESLARLRREGLVVRGADKQDPRRVFRCINPLVAATGGPHRRRLQWAQFQRALE